MSALKKYKLTKNGYRNTETGDHIPKDPNNRHFKAVQEWIAKGNTPSPLQTAAEKTAAQAAKIRSLQDEIIHLKIRKDAADAENFSGFATELGELITTRKAELKELTV